MNGPTGCSLDGHPVAASILHGMAILVPRPPSVSICQTLEAWSSHPENSLGAAEAVELAGALVSSLAEGGCVCCDIASGEVLAFAASDAEELAALAMKRVFPHG